MNFVIFATKVEIFRRVSGVYPEFREQSATLAGASLWTAPRRK
jgi:hypothetical protein